MSVVCVDVCVPVCLYACVGEHVCALCVCVLDYTCTCTGLQVWFAKLYHLPNRHPDKNKSPEAQEKIMQLNKAYEVRSCDAQGKIM